MQARRLTLENLESRMLMAVSSVRLSDHVLKIQADDRGSDVRVYSSGADLMVRESAPSGRINSWSFTKSDVSKIEFRGGSGRDIFDNDAYIPVEAWGNAGDDTLNGGNHHDILHGGDGNDTLIGMGGNDRLYGGDGKDVLRGGEGHDSLFGGGSSSADELYGGPGRDRFLTQSTDVIKDGSGIDSRSGEDAQIRFVDRDERWSNREIEIVDQAFAQLFAARGDNRLLKETRNNAPLTFYQERLPSGEQGVNREFTYSRGCWQEGPWYNRRERCDHRTRFDRREIALPDWNANSSKANAQVIDTVLHEIGHNYDSAQIHPQIWSDFKAVSGWVQNPANKSGLHRGADFGTGRGEHQGWYRSTNNRSRFAEDYGGTNPMEDWATCWSLYFAQGRSTAHKNSVVSQKLRLIERMVQLA